MSEYILLLSVISVVDREFLIYKLHTMAKLQWNFAIGECPISEILIEEIRVSRCPSIYRTIRIVRYLILFQTPVFYIQIRK
jgi:hypothetical protein